jgi:hypothetical protein
LKAITIAGCKNDRLYERCRRHPQSRSNSGAGQRHAACNFSRQRNTF